MNATFSDRRVPAFAAKSMLGHCMSAGGGLETVALLLALRNGVAPPTINYQHPDPACDIDCVPNRGTPVSDLHRDQELVRVRWRQLLSRLSRLGAMTEPSARIAVTGLGAIAVERSFGRRDLGQLRGRDLGDSSAPGTEADRAPSTSGARSRTSTLEPTSPRRDRLTYDVSQLYATARPGWPSRMRVHRDLRPDPVGVVIGTGVGASDPTWQRSGRSTLDGPRAVSAYYPAVASASLSASLPAMRLGLRGPVYGVTGACASAAFNLVSASHLLVARDADLVLAGAVDTLATQSSARRVREYALARMAPGAGAGLATTRSRSQRTRALRRSGRRRARAVRVRTGTRRADLWSARRLRHHQRCRQGAGSRTQTVSPAPVAVRLTGESQSDRRRPRQHPCCRHPTRAISSRRRHYTRCSERAQRRSPLQLRSRCSVMRWARVAGLETVVLMKTLETGVIPPDHQPRDAGPGDRPECIASAGQGPGPHRPQDQLGPRRPE